MVGETLGSYRVLDQLGQGGMGTVYLAEHRHLHRKAAIKVLLKEFVSRPDLLDRFFAEARATSLIEHPGIVQIFDCEVDADGRPYIVMEFLGGETLAGHLQRRGPLPAAEAAGYARCMAEALAAAHDKGIIHRDIKPDNVFVKPGPPPSAKLVDFGIAKLAGEFHAGLTSRTQTGIVMGTPLYMSPEQCRGAGTVDYRTDIYSLGCLLFEMLVGRRPFEYEGAGELVAAHLTEAPPRVAALIGGVPPALDQLVAAMLSKSVADRPQTMRQVAEQLGAPATTTGPPAAAVVTPAPPATPTPPAPTTPAPVRTPVAMTTLRGTASEMHTTEDGDLTIPRRRGGLVVAAVALVVVAGGGLFAWRRLGPAGSDPASVPGSMAAPHEPTSPPAPIATGTDRPARAANPTPPARQPETASSRDPSPRAGAPAAARGKKPKSRVAASAPPPVSPPPHAPGDGLLETRSDVRVGLRSDPSGASVCLDGDRRLLGRTPHNLSLPRDGRRWTVLLQLAGYRLKEVAVSADRDLDRTVKLEPLGADELAPAAVCQ